MTDPRLDSLLHDCPGLRLKTDPADLEHYGRDWTRRWVPAPLAIALPGTVDEVQAILRWASAQHVAVVPSGGRTGLSGGAVAAHDELVLSLERMNKPLAFDAVDRTLTVQAGMALEAVHNAALEHGLIYPVDFAARGSCSIGGNIATNAGGIRVIRYGNTREWFFTDRALQHVLAHGAQAPFAEVYPYYVVTEFAAGDEAQEAAAMAAFEDCMEHGWVSDGVVSQSDAQAAQLWRLREGITEAVARYKPYKNDVSVRISAMPAFLAETQALIGQAYPQFEVVWFGHIGDGNLHINVLKPDDTADTEFLTQCEHVTKLLAGVLSRFDGSISAEHGIGLVKKGYLDSTRSAPEIALMKAVKRAFDPQALLNPGKVFDL